MQLEAPTPKPILRKKPLNSSDELTQYGDEYHGQMGFQEAEKLLDNTADGSFLLRKSPKAEEYFTLSVRFNKKTKHFKIYYKPGKGHYLQEQSKHFETINELVADGLITFYIQLHAAPILSQINQQTLHSFQQSPYMTLNRRKLRALSNEMRKSLIKTNSQEQKETDVDLTPENPANNNTDVADASLGIDPILPLIYEKAHNFRTHTFKGLNWCEFCANFLWGFTAQGVKCEACGFIAHFKCGELVPPKCLPDLKRIRGVFGTDLTTIVQIHRCSIPFVVKRCVEEVEARGMLQEGIYRVSGFADEIEGLKMALDRDGDKTDMSEMAYGNINVIAGTLKLYLRLLPVPLITFQAYPHFMQASSKLFLNNKLTKFVLKSPFYLGATDITEQIGLTYEAAKKLPPAHYNCLKFMCEHLKRFVDIV